MIIKKFSFALILGLWLLVSAGAQTLPTAKQIPAPSTEQQTLLIREGETLHDKGNFDGAIAKYEEVLKESPTNAKAIYELAYSYAGKQNFKKSLELALRGAVYQSDFLSDYYVLIGNDYDQLDQPDKAMEVYKEALNVFPEKTGLHFNLGVTLYRQNKIDEAKNCFKRCAVLTPNYLSSHYILSQIFYKQGYQVPTILAACRFLAADATSARAEFEFKLLKQALQLGITKKSDKETNITLNINAPKDEGDFESLNVFIGLLGAGSSLEENKNKTETQLFVEEMGTLFAVMTELGAKESKNGKDSKDAKKPAKPVSGFCIEYYVPYFLELHQKHYDEAFAYYISQSGKSPEVAKWLEEHKTQVSEFLTWSKGFAWPKPKV